MFYQPADVGQHFRIDPFKALVTPRPIGWISSVDPEGRVNLAPYSFFNAVGENPPSVVFSSAGRKDSLRNIEATGEFVCSLATFELQQQMNATSASVAAGVDEMVLAGLVAAPSRLVKPPRVAASPVALECRHVETVALPSHSADGYLLVIGEVVGIHIDDRFIADGRVDTAAMRPIARLGYSEYCVVTPETRFSLRRPG